MPLLATEGRQKTPDGSGPHKSQIRDPLYLFQAFFSVDLQLPYLLLITALIIQIYHSTFPPIATSGFKTSIFRLLHIFINGEPMALKY